MIVKVRNLFIHNWQLKLMSLLFSLLLWLFIVFEKSSEISIDIPVDYGNLPKNKLIANNNVDKISVLIKGPRAILARIGSIKPYKINLSNVKNGKFQLRVMSEELHIPTGVEVVKIVPSKIDLEIDDIYEKKLNVKLRTKGLLPPGYELKKIDITPSVVKVKGARSQLNNRKIIFTESIDISSIISSQEFDVPLDIGNMSIIEITGRMVHVNILVETKNILKEFLSVPIIVVGNKKYFLKKKLANIKVYGPQIILGTMKPNDIKAYINIANLRKGRRKVKVNVDLPVNVSLVNIKPIFLEVIIN